MPICCLKGPIKKELNFDFRTLLPEECGLFLGFNINNASFNCVRALRAQEPRGERGAGVFSLHKGVFYSRRRVGKVSRQFQDYDQSRCRKEFPGRIAIGQCRYATMGGADSVDNVQPFLRDTKYGELVIGHNGTLMNAARIRQELINSGRVLSTTSDTELFFHMICMSGEDNLEKAILYALRQIRTAYSLVVVSREKSFAIRDRYGIRPLSLAKLDRGYIACSETFAIDQIVGTRYWRDVEPGEMVVFEKDKKPRSIHYAEQAQKSRFCIFEPVYFMRPRSRVNGCYVEDFRYALGLAMAEDIRGKVKELGIDLVVPILDSGEYFARGLADGLGVKYLEALARTKNFSANVQDRSFTAAGPRERDQIILSKHNLRADLVRRKRVLVVDDSIVRGNTLRRIIKLFTSAGVEFVCAAVGYPPIGFPCINGMDFPTKTELIATEKTIPEVIKRRLGLKWLFYMMEKTLARVAQERLKVGICGVCYTGNYFQK